MGKDTITAPQWGSMNLDTSHRKTQLLESANYNRSVAVTEEKKCKAWGCHNIIYTEKGADLCVLHTAKRGGSDTREIIESPNYRSLDEAAMAAANIILNHACINGSIEYGIGIYHRYNYNQHEPQRQGRDEYYLLETRLGGMTNVSVDDETLEDKSKGKRIFNGNEYRFKAHVHSHPIIDPYGLSEGDYMLSCGDDKEPKDVLFNKNKSPYPMYLVGLVDTWSKNYDYNIGEIVHVIDNNRVRFWIATSDHKNIKPGNGDRSWKRIPERNKNIRYESYNDGELVRDIENYIFWKRDVSNPRGRILYIPPKLRERSTLTKFTPPILSDGSGDYDRKKARELAVIMGISMDFGVPYDIIKNILSQQHILSTGHYEIDQEKLKLFFKEKHKYDIIKDYGGQLEKMTIIENFNNITNHDWKKLWKNILIQN